MLDIIYYKYISPIFKDKNNILIFLIVFITGLIAHFDFFTNEHLIGDNVGSGIVYISGTWERGLGRWLIPFIDNIRNGLVAKVPIFFIYLMCFSISTILIVKTLKIKNKFLISVCAILIVAYPSIVVTLLFTYTLDSYAISILLASLAAYLMNRDYNGKRKIALNIISIICMILSLALYQAYLQITIVLCIITTIFKLLENKNSKDVIKKLFENALICIISLIIYYISLNIFLKLNNENIGTYKDIDKFGIKSIGTYLEQIKFSYNFFYKVFFTDYLLMNTVCYRQLAHGGIIISIIFLYVYICCKKRLYKINILWITILTCLLPLFANIINIIVCNQAITEVVIMVYVLFYIFVLKLLDITTDDTKLMKIVKITILSMIIYIDYTFLLGGYTSYTLKQRIFYDYYTDMVNIFSRIKQIEEYNESHKILFIGNLEHDVEEFNKWNKTNGLIDLHIIWNEFYGYTLISNFGRRYLGELYSNCSYDEYLEIINTEEYKNMSLYPDRYAIKVVKDIVVVKIREDY